jgi:NAD(P)-dependent dehydrogenase (short-subunit alcohol dehydrogenase family)
MDRMTEPDQRVAIVTGGLGGLGQAVTAALRATSWKVATFDTLPEAPGPDLAITVDVSDETSVAAGFDRVERDLGPATAIVCLAGVVFDAPVVGLAPKKLSVYPLADWQRTLAVNLTGTFLCAREFAARAVKGRRKATVVTCSSPAADGAPGQAAYAASKAGVEALTRAMATELAPLGVRVCGFRPALTHTPMADRYPKHVLDRLKGRSQIGRYARPEEVAKLVLFLLDSELIAGETVRADGGLRL